MTGHSTPTIVLGIAIVCLSAAAGPATAPAPKLAPTIDNPIYASWAKYKVGSAVTWTGDLVGPDGKATHMVVTTTLKGVAADGLTIESTGEAGGAKSAPSTATVPAKVRADQVVQKGHETVTAMGKAYACDVYAISGRAFGAPGDKMLTVSRSADVPGGSVKMVAHTPWGKDLVLMVTGTDVK